MRRSNNFWLLLVAGVTILELGNLSSTLGQVPTPTPLPTVPQIQSPIRADISNGLTSAPAVRLATISLNGGAQKPLASLSSLPGPIAEFLVPRNPVAGSSWQFEVRSSEGSGTVIFSHRVPAGVPASAFQWEQNSGTAPGARGTLRYNGCEGCPASFTVEIGVKEAEVRVPGSISSDSAPRTAQVKVVLSASGGPPSLTSIERIGSDTIRPQFRLRFAPGTFIEQDNHSEVIATYSGGLKVRLVTDDFGNNSVVVVIPRLKASRNVSVELRNSFGGSNRSVELPIQEFENAPLQFSSVASSQTSGQADIHGKYSIKHTNLTPLDASGTDEITIEPRRSGATPCDQPDVIYNTAVTKWIREDGYSGDSSDQGTVKITSHPPEDHLLRSPDNKIRVSWTLKGLKGERWYQVMFGVIDVVGVCQDRVIQ